MGFAFLSPWFFAGLVVLSVPLVIHLVHRQRPGGIEFPSLMFLRRLPLRERSLLRIRDPWLLLLRALALLLLLLAFARPYLTSLTMDDAVATGSRDIVILLDRSYSMGFGQRWGQAMDQAEAVLNDLKPGDRAALLVFDHSTQERVGLGGDRESLAATLGGLEPGVGGTDLALALARAAHLLASSKAEQRQVILISDLQSSGLAADAVPRLPEGVALKVLPLIDEESNAPLLTGVTLTARKIDDREQMVIAAQLATLTEQAGKNLTLSLELSGRVRETKPLDNIGDGNIPFSPLPLPAKPTAAVVHLRADGAPTQQFHFILAATPRLKVLLVTDAGSDSYQDLYPQTVLAVSTDPRYQVDIIPVTELSAAAIDGRALIIINDAPVPGGAVRERLRAYVEAGGGLLLTLGDGVQGGWPGGAAGWLPGELGERLTRSDGVAVRIAADAQLLALSEQAERGVFDGTTVWRYRRLSLTAGERVLASYDDASPALVERSLGAGRVLVLTTTLEPDWNNLVLQPGFVPFLQRIAAYLADYRPSSPWYPVGATLDAWRYLRSTHALGVTDLTIEAPSGQALRLDWRQPALSLQEVGVYELHPGAAAEPALLAANVPASEFELTRLTPEQLLARVLFTQVPVVQSEPTANRQSATAAEQQRLWWYLLVLMVVVLLLESWLAAKRV